MDERTMLLQRFTDCGWDLIAASQRPLPAGWLQRPALRTALEQAQQECGSCG